MTSSAPPPPPDPSKEIRELAERVSALRQDLESVEARLRGLAGLGFETVEIPTVLTTNHALRRATQQRAWTIAAVAALVLIGMGLGTWMTRSPATPPVASAPVPAPGTAAPPAATEAEPAIAAAPTLPADPEPDAGSTATAATMTATAAASAPAERKRSFLTIVTHPSARVREGDRILGTTPLFKAPLDPGEHALLLEGSDGSKKTVHVTLVPGETANLQYSIAGRVDRGF